MSDLRRHLLGVSGLVFLVLACVLAMSSLGAGVGKLTIGALVRSGLVLCALWLALPSVVALYRHFPKWVWIGSAVVLLAAVLQGRITIIIGAFFLVIIALQFLGRIFRPSGAAAKSTGSDSKRRG